MKKIIFVIGGCRSGKSGHAQHLAENIDSKNRIFVATCIPCDEEMRDRVKKHQEVRDSTWKTVEAPILLPDVLREYGKEENVVLADCLTLWCSNLLMYPDIAQEIDLRADRLIHALENVSGTVILVSNEVGSGIVPENRLARQFRDIAGMLNRKTAAVADEVIWMVAGIPVKIK
ncbi:MAG: bifunctional adenosylcobinamide kinase/adenosylcobinamide-phosphate guanylyltransferase [Desulfobacterales bacterium]